MATHASTAELVGALGRTKGKAEIVGGEIVLMSPAGGRQGRVAACIYRSLWAYERETRRGRAYPDNVGFLVDLEGRKSFSPDAAFHEGPPPGEGFLEGAPVFAVEVRSPDEYGAAAEKVLARKRAQYFAAGTRVVWDVDALRQGVIRAYRHDAPEAPSTYVRGQVAAAEPALPGWTFAVDDLFED